MNTTLIIPDLHGKDTWKNMITQTNPNQIVFLGDYFDCYGEYTAVEQIANFKEIINYKQNNPNKIVKLLIGNHDHHYLPGIGFSQTSGYQVGAAPSIQQVLSENLEHLQMCHQDGKYLFTHAGVSSVFLDETLGIDGWDVNEICNLINDLYKYKPKVFLFNGRDYYGYDVTQTPIWIRPEALMMANKKSSIKSKYIQIVGHTKLNEIDIKGKATGGRYYFVDTLDSVNKQFLTIEDGVVKLHELAKI